MHVDQELLVYEAFPHDSQLGQGNLKVRFKKVRRCELGGGAGRAGRGRGELAGRGLALMRHPRQVPHNISFREKKPKPSKKKTEGGTAEEGTGARGRVARFRYFEDIYGYSGVGRRRCGARGGVGPPRRPHGASAGVHLRPLAPLAPGDRPRGPAAAPHGHRRPHRLLRPVSQCQLPPGVPVLQQTGRGLGRLPPTHTDAAQGVRTGVGVAWGPLTALPLRSCVALVGAHPSASLTCLIHVTRVIAVIPGSTLRTQCWWCLCCQDWGRGRSWRSQGGSLRPALWAWPSLTLAHATAVASTPVLSEPTRDSKLVLAYPILADLSPSGAWSPLSRFQWCQASLILCPPRAS